MAENHEPTSPIGGEPPCECPCHQPGWPHATEDKFCMCQCKDAGQLVGITYATYNSLARAYCELHSDVELARKQAERARINALGIVDNLARRVIVGLIEDIIQTLK